MASLAYVAMLLPVGLYVALVARDGVNVPYADDLVQVHMIVAAASGHLSLQQIWLPHNGNRLVFPNLFALALLLPTRYNMTAEMWTSAVMAIAAFVILGISLGRTCQLRGWWLLPIAILFFDPVQWENMLWGFQLAWYLTLIMLTLVVYALTSTGNSRGRYFGAVAGALVGTFSLLQGLIIWPVGAFLLLSARPCNKGRIAAWFLLAVVSGIVYFYGSTPLESHSALYYSLSHPGVTATYFVTIVGGAASQHAEKFGLLVLGGCLAVGILYWWRSDLRQQLRIPIALIAFSLLFDLVATVGRANLGASEAMASRYTTYNMLSLIAIYVALVVWFRTSHPSTETLMIWTQRRTAAAAICGLCMVAILGLVADTLPGAVRQGTLVRESRTSAQLLLIRYKTTPDQALADALYPPSAAFVRSCAHALQQERWSVFGGQAGRPT